VRDHHISVQPDGWEFSARTPISARGVVPTRCVLSKKYSVNRKVTWVSSPSFSLGWFTSRPGNIDRATLLGNSPHRDTDNCLFQHAVSRASTLDEYSDIMGADRGGGR
jgi:hypothetical protein